jgi:hypothetical protein
MTRERIARAALLAYPEGVRAANGIEMLGTVLDAGSQSTAAFCRELAGLASGGLRARITTPAGLSPGRLVADGARYSAILMIAVLFATRLGIAATLGTFVRTRSLVELAVLGIALAAALVRYDRIAGLATFAWLALTLDSPYLIANEKIFAVTFALPVACLLVMILSPRTNGRRLLRVAWLVPIAALGIAGRGYGPSSYLVLAPFVLALPAALVLAASDQRLVIACSLFATEIAMADIGRALEGGPIPIGLPLTIFLLATTPLVIAFTIRRTGPPKPQDAA